MNNRIDIMTDIETLGKENNTTVFQISACAFNIETGRIFDTFNEIADISLEKDMLINGDTLIWWLNTNKELLTSLLNRGKESQISQEDMFYNFHNWIENLSDVCENKDVFLWGNGMLFDNKLIQSKMKQYNIEYPIFYRNDRDMRTIVELAGLKIGINTEKEFREKYRDDTLIAHDAFDDVKSQIQIVTKAWNILLND